MPQIKFYCVTNKKVDFFKSDLFNFGWVGDGVPPKNYLTCNDKDNIFDREKFYSELTFHYWYWKNILYQENKDQWNLTEADIQDLVVTDQHVRSLSGATMVYLMQRYQGIKVYNAIYNVGI